MGVRFTLPTTPSIESGGPFYPSDHPGHQIWGSVLPFRPPRTSNLGVIFTFRPPRASNLGVRFTLPTTPGIEFGGHFHLPDSSEVKFGGHSCIIDLPDTLIWGSSFPSLVNSSPFSSQNQRAKANPRIYFLPSQDATTGNPRRNEVEVGRSWHEVPEGLSGSREGNSEGSGNLVPLPRLLFIFKLHFLL